MFRGIGAARPAFFGFLLTAVIAGAALAEELPAGLKELATRAYSPSLLDAEIFANLWRSWEAPARDAAEKASDSVRRTMTLKRYGLLEAPFDNRGAPLGMVVKQDGSYALSCLACHAGAVEGRTILGLPNTALDFSGLFEDIEKTIRILHAGKPGNPPFPPGLLFMTHGKPAARVDFPEGLLSVSRGTYNSFSFSVHFFSYRDKDLNVVETPQDLKPLNNYIDAPPLWNVAKRTRFYWDGFTAKSVRALMQFSLDPSIGGDLFKSWEPDYEKIYAWLHTLKSPQYAGSIDEVRAAKGKQVYADTCVDCHGTPGAGGDYPNKIVSIRKVQTDGGRLAGLSSAFKEHYSSSWLGEYGQTSVKTRSGGYVPPPLDGILATAPYFHNGSVPTLYHVLFPDERPAVWKVVDYDAYDEKRVGLQVEELAEMPPTTTFSQKRGYFDTHRPTMSNTGHPFADKLTRKQKLDLLEYLKTL